MRKKFWQAVALSTDQAESLNRAAIFLQLIIISRPDDRLHSRLNGV